MSDDTTAEAAPAAADVTPTDTTDAAPAAAEEPAATDAISAEAASKLRREAKNLRDGKKAAETEAAALRAKVEEHEAEKLSETERLQKQADDATQAAQAAASRAKAANLRAIVTAEAAKHGVDPEAARKLIAEEIEYDDADEPTNVSDLIASVIESGVLASKTQAPAGGLPANAQGGAEKQKTHAEKLAETQENRFGVNPYEHPEALGGGVFLPPGA